MFKNINWKQIGFRSLQGVLVAILNTPLWTLLIGSMVNNGSYYKLDGEGLPIFDSEKEFSWFADLEMTPQALIIVFIFIGIALSGLFIKFLYTQNRQDKRMEKQTKELKNGTTREQKDINKYL